MDDASRRDVADVVDSVPCWMAVALLTLADVVLFAWQLLPGTNAAEAQWLRGLELAINALFVCELGLRFVAAGGDFLSSTMNVFDTVVIVCAFVLCLAEFTAAPIVALRGLRILRYVCRGVRGACAASRIDAGFEMRGLVRRDSLNNRGATLMVFDAASFLPPSFGFDGAELQRARGSPRRRRRVASTAPSSTPSLRRLDGVKLEQDVSQYERGRVDAVTASLNAVTTLLHTGPRRAPRARGRPRAAPPGPDDGRRRGRARRGRVLGAAVEAARDGRVDRF